MIIAERKSVKYSFYSGDIQLYISLDPDNELSFSTSLKNLEYCLADIRLWMIQNILRLNDNKTNIIYLASSKCAKSLNMPALQMGGSSITPIRSIQNLRVTFDKHINMYKHITSICLVVVYHLKNIHCSKIFY